MSIAARAMPEHEFKMQRRVEFAETDMAGILHFSNYLRYMEEVEHAFFRSLGLSVQPCAKSGILGWARGKVSCTYRKPLHFEGDSSEEDDAIQRKVDVVKKALSDLLARGLRERPGVFS